MVSNGDDFDDPGFSYPIGAYDGVFVSSSRTPIPSLTLSPPRR